MVVRVYRVLGFIWRYHLSGVSNSLYHTLFVLIMCSRALPGVLVCYCASESASFRNYLSILCDPFRPLFFYPVRSQYDILKATWMPYYSYFKATKRHFNAILFIVLIIIFVIWMLYLIGNLLNCLLRYWTIHCGRYFLPRYQGSNTKRKTLFTFSWIYSHNAIGFPGGPSVYHINERNSWVDGGCGYGNEVRAAPFYVQRKLRCGYYIEPQYYNHNTGTKGRSIVTVGLFAICFEDDDIVSWDKIKNKKNFGGK